MSLSHKSQGHEYENFMVMGLSYVAPYHEKAITITRIEQS